STTAAIPESRTSILAIAFSVFPVAGLILVRQRMLRREIRQHGRVVLLAVLAMSALSCGGGLQGNGGGSGSPGTPAGTYAITVTATCKSVVHTAQVSLTVTP
ncbi:MAG TPA: hypothetical protein VGU90_10045, partial [Terriglobales bacterium]|nr:hypothetical protein [Terriglobales bacterium]